MGFVLDAKIKLKPSVAPFNMLDFAIDNELIKIELASRGGCVPSILYVDQRLFDETGLCE